MKLVLNPKARRAAFTLVELLVVMAIIAVLMALLLAAVMKAMSKGDEVRARSDITGLQTAIEHFQSDFKVDYIPSRIVLHEDMNYAVNSPNPLIANFERDSLQYLQRLWPRLAGSNRGGTVGVDWNGDGVIQTGPAGTYYLEGDQCLVFFLGGIPGGAPTGAVIPGRPGPATELGFATDPTDPSIPPAVNAPRKVPFFDGFQSARLLDRTGNHFYSYKDIWGKNVYAYFSSYKTPNGYFRYVNYPAAVIPNNTGSDCSTLGVSPYADSLAGSLHCLNPNSFQIISAGANGVFGRGSLPTYSQGDPAPIWTNLQAGGTPATWGAKNPPNSPAASLPNLKDMGKDDLGNFHGTFLGLSKE
jgi:prepilin-type N-terminal cleavage/methylation domain-containing protein